MLKKIETREEAIQWYSKNNGEDVYMELFSGSIVLLETPVFADFERYFVTNGGRDLYKLTDMSIKVTPKKRPMTNSEIFCALRDGAILMDFAEDAINYWDSENDISSYKICYNYTDTDSDIWEELEVGE